MSKLAPETIVFAPGEGARKNMDFAADLQTDDIGSTPDFIMSAGGPAISMPAFSGKKAQAFFDASNTAPGVYYCDCTVYSNSSPPNRHKGRGKIVVSNLG